MSLSSDAEAQWIWYDSNTWQSYDTETNRQIEDAYSHGAESVKLCVGHFGKLCVYFDYKTNPPSFHQINVITKDVIQIKRTLAFKPRRMRSLLSNIKRIQIYKHLYKYKYNKQSIDKAIKVFNQKYKNHKTTILNKTNSLICKELIAIIENQKRQKVALNTSKNRFHRNNLNLNVSIHKFNFEYHKDNKKYDEKNAKHPSEYINRKCYKCKGLGCVNRVNSNRVNGIMEACTKCKGGIYRKSYSLKHSKCNGLGCAKCNESGLFPLKDIMCNNCCPPQLIYNQCMSGHRLPQLIPFVPKRQNELLSAHGTVCLRLYHTTNKECAHQIIKTGVMFGGQNGGIIFGDAVQAMAKQRGYLVIADVFIGKCKEEYEMSMGVNLNFDFHKLHSLGYDSIRKYAKQKSHSEYIIFNWDQVWVHVVLPFDKVAI